MVLPSKEEVRSGQRSKAFMLATNYKQQQINKKMLHMRGDFQRHYRCWEFCKREFIIYVWTVKTEIL